MVGDEDDDTSDEPEVVTVRLTESVAESSSVLRQLHELDGTLRFPTLAAAHEFEQCLERELDGTYTLTPDHHEDGTTFYLRRHQPRE